MRLDYAEPGVGERVYALLDTCFPRLSERIALAEGVGARWAEVSTPFVAFADGGGAVAHVGVIFVPMVVAGGRRTVAGVHAVCTRPEHRGRGHARRLMDEALSFVDERGVPALLTTGIPGFYEPFGFRVVPEVTFRPRVAPRPAAAAIAARRTDPGDPAAPPPMRRLRLDDAYDGKLAWRLLGERAPVSDVLASADPGWLFLIDEALGSFGFERLWYAEDLDVMVACEVADGGLLRLLDVVGPRLPSLTDVLARLPAWVAWDAVELCFTPDRVWEGPSGTVAWDPTDVLMARGDVPPLGEVALSPLARW